MEIIHGIPIRQKEIDDFCRRQGIKSMSLFGSVITERFDRFSDIDILVEFEKDSIPGLLKLSSMERELSTLFGGRKVDLRTPMDLSRYFRDEVIENRVILYAAS